jgi:hypothetical protein
MYIPKQNSTTIIDVGLVSRFCDWELISIIYSILCVLLLLHTTVCRTLVLFYFSRVSDDFEMRWRKKQIAMINIILLVIISSLLSLSMVFKNEMCYIWGLLLKLFPPPPQCDSISADQCEKKKKELTRNQSPLPHLYYSLTSVCGWNSCVWCEKKKFKRYVSVRRRPLTPVSPNWKLFWNLLFMISSYYIYFCAEELWE